MLGSDAGHPWVEPEDTALQDHTDDEGDDGDEVRDNDERFHHLIIFRTLGEQNPRADDCQHTEDAGGAHNEVGAVSQVGQVVTVVVASVGGGRAGEANARIVTEAGVERPVMELGERRAEHLELVRHEIGENECCDRAHEGQDERTLVAGFYVVKKRGL